MNYRHAFHAGNFADVFKHIVLIILIKALAKKENTFCYLETHAGSGRYDLFSKNAQKSKEYESGIAELFRREHSSPFIKNYLECVRSFNDAENPYRFYPGSPLIATYFLRPQDEMILCELHEEEFLALKNIFKKDPQVHLHHINGYQSFKAFLPPKERRGLILIDPPYEKPDEFDTLISEISVAVKRFETGIYVIWYPIKPSSPVESFKRKLKEKISREIFFAEFKKDNFLPTQLNACGIAIINPPWKVEEEIKRVLRELQRIRLPANLYTIRSAETHALTECMSRGIGDGLLARVIMEYRERESALARIASEAESAKRQEKVSLNAKYNPQYFASEPAANQKKEAPAAKTTAPRRPAGSGRG